MVTEKNGRALAAHFAANRIAAGLVAGGCLENVGWTDAAREVSLRVRQNKARIRELMKGRPDGMTYRDASGTWIKRGGDVELVRVDGVYAAGQNGGRFITELAAGRPGDFFDPYSKGTLSAMERYGYLTPAQGAASRAFYGYGNTANRVATERLGLVENIGWTDEARAASLAVRQKQVAARQAAQDAAKPFKPQRSGKAKAPSGGSVPRSRGIREQTPEMEAALGNPNTPFEGKRIVGHGGVFEVKNGVLVKVESIAPGMYTGPDGMVKGQMGSGGGAYKGGSALPAYFKTLLKKMEDAGVDVYSGFGMKKPGKDRRRF